MSNKNLRKVCVVLVDRANYGRMKPVMEAIKKHSKLQLQIVCTGTMLLERFGEASKIVENDDFCIDSKIFVELEGSLPSTMAKSIGIAMLEFATEFQRLDPDVVLLIGDRYEALAAAITAAYMNILITHVQGGEVSGSIDESARHAISKFAQFHFPATERASQFLMKMGERPETVLGIGCPSSDIAAEMPLMLSDESINAGGGGCFINAAEPYLLVVFHPVTTEYGGENTQIDTLLASLERINMQTLFLWPNIDAGSDHISKQVRRFRDREETQSWFRNATNFPPEEYLRILANAAGAIGNSSSFVRDAGYFGTPVVLVGSRQDGRETDKHVRRVPPQIEKIEDAIRERLSHGRYPPSSLYGDGKVSGRIASALSTLIPYTQKRLNYLDES